MSSFVRATGALAMTALLSACSGDGDPAGPGNDTGNVVQVQASSFSPANMTVPVGTTVRWVNQAAIIHTITPQGHTRWQPHVLSQSGQSFEHTFDVAGTFAYFCQEHAPGMAGVITVGGGNPGGDGGGNDTPPGGGY